MKAKYLVLLGALLLVVDQVSKIVIKLSMTLSENIAVAGTWFNIHFVENEGAAWGMSLGGDYGKLFLTLFRIVACVLIFFWIKRLRKKDTPKGILIALTLVLVGALGNVIDSAFYGMIFSESTVTSVAEFAAWGEGYGTFLHGKVVDMLYFPLFKIGNFEFFNAIFNLADSYISVAVIYVLIFQRKFFNDKQKTTK
ncbi:MAG: lipoprotein signal peptidase [Rikenellaceae bacterium]